MNAKSLEARVLRSASAVFGVSESPSQATDTVFVNHRLRLSALKSQADVMSCWLCYFV